MAVDWSYVAGYFDGEGHAGVYANGSWGLTFTNTHRPSLEAMLTFIGRGMITSRNKDTCGGLGSKICYNLVIRRVEDVRAVCAELIPRCLVKRAALERLLGHLRGRKGCAASREKMRQLDPMEIKRLYDRGLSTYEIDDRVGVAHGAIDAFLRRHGVPLRSQREATSLARENGRWVRHSALCAVDPALVRAMYWDERLTLPQVASRLGVHHQTVGAYMQRHNIPRRGHGGLS